MLTDRRYAKRMQDDNAVQLPLLLSILMHVILGIGLYFISRPHPPKTAVNIQTTLVTADMLRAMTAEAKQAQKTRASTTAQPNKTATNQHTSQEVTSRTLVPSVLAPSQQTKSAQKSNPPQQAKKQKPAKQPRIFEPVTEDKKSKKPEDISKKVTPKIGAPDKESTKQTQEWAKKQQKAMEKLRKQKDREKELKRKAKRNEEKALAKQKADEKRRAKEKKAREAQRLKDYKKAEAEKDKKLAERRKEHEAAQKAQRAKQDKERKEQERKRRQASLSEGSKNLGGLSEFDNEAKQIQTGMSQAKKLSIRDQYYAKIGAKVKRKLKGKTSKAASMPIRLSLSPNGAIIAARPVGTSGDPEIDRILLDAVRSASPLPVPKDSEIFNKYFKNVTLDLGTE